MKTILLVDDDPQLRIVFHAALSRQGYRVIEAESGKEGLEMARKYLPDLILSDIHMPGGDGSSLLREIRQDPTLRSRQVVLITGRPDLITPRKGMEDGADDFLVKPVSLASLMSCVEARFSRASINWRVEDETLARIRSAVPTHLPHEFFTPLAGIIGLLEILRSSSEALNKEEIQDIYNDAYQSSLRLHRTLRNYLLILDLQGAVPVDAVSALTARQTEQSIHDGVSEALRLNDRREDLTIRVHPSPIRVKLGDLTHIIEELVDNACKFSRPGTAVEVSLGEDGCLSVSDHGKGMTAEEISRVGAFQQFDRKKQEQQGLGLGLVLVQKISALYGAELSITSQPGEGTRVQIPFPVASAE